MNHQRKQISVGLTHWAAAMMVAIGEPGSPALEDAENLEFEVTPTEIKLPAAGE
jgi:hypothetical protein